MAKTSFIFIASTFVTILAAGSVLMGVFSAALKEVSNDASMVAANFCSTFLIAAIFVAILIAVVLMITGKNLKL